MIGPTLRVLPVLVLSLLWLGCQPQVAERTGAPQPAVAPSADSPSGVESASTGEGGVAASQPEPVWCQVSGEKGALLTCPLVVEVSSGEPSPTGIQMTLNWASADLSFKGLRSTLCPPGGLPCAELLSPPSKTFGGKGHSVAMQPKDLTTASGRATLMIYHASNPTAALEAEIGQLVFEARRPLVRSVISLDALSASGPEAQPLTLQASHQRLKVSL